MFFKEENVDDKVEELKKRDQELTENLSSLFEEFDVLPEEMDAFLANRENFSDEEWAVMEKQRQVLEGRLKRDLDNLPDPNKTKDAYKKIRMKSNWISV